MTRLTRRRVAQAIAGFGMGMIVTGMGTLFVLAWQHSTLAGASVCVMFGLLVVLLGVLADWEG